MNKKGFTLTELLATIVILSVVITIAVPSVIGVSNLIKKNMFESKKKLLLQAAKLYGEDKEGEFTDGKKIYLPELAEQGYIKCDEGVSATDCFLNPQTNASMKWCEIQFSYNNGRVTAKWYSTKNDDCNWK